MNENIGFRSGKKPKAKPEVYKIEDWGFGTVTYKVVDTVADEIEKAIRADERNKICTKIMWFLEKYDLLKNNQSCAGYCLLRDYIEQLINEEE